MTSSYISGKVASDCANLKQGAVVEFEAILQQQGALGPNGEGSTALLTPLGVVVLSQTCDIVQRSKSYCLVAPVIATSDNNGDPGLISSARKGRAPLHLYLITADDVEMVADIGKLASVPKKLLERRRLIWPGPDQAHGQRARQLGDRISRAFDRFPFPDEVYPSFRKLREKIQKSAGRNGAFAQVLEMINELRISADQWSKPGRHLTLYCLVDDGVLVDEEYEDPGWVWSPTNVRGLKLGEKANELSLTRVCELLLLNLGEDDAAAELWRRFEEAVQKELLEVGINEEVAVFDVAVLSESQMTYKEYKRTESLDLEVLSHSTS